MHFVEKPSCASSWLLSSESPAACCRTGSIPIRVLPKPSSHDPGSAGTSPFPRKSLHDSGQRWSSLPQGSLDSAHDDDEVSPHADDTSIETHTLSSSHRSANRRLGEHTHLQNRSRWSNNRPVVWFLSLVLVSTLSAGKRCHCQCRKLVGIDFHGLNPCLLCPSSQPVKYLSNFLTAKRHVYLSVRSRT